MQKLVFFIAIISVGCGSGTHFTSKQYHDLHFKTRHDHVDLIQHSSPTIDTMLQTMINMLEENEDQEECIRTWHKTKTFIHEAEMQNQIYVNQVIITDVTQPLQQEMYNSHNRIIGLENDLGYDIELAIRANDKTKAVTRLKDLKVLISKEWNTTLTAALAYNDLAFKTRGER